MCDMGGDYTGGKATVEGPTHSKTANEWGTRHVSCLFSASVFVKNNKVTNSQECSHGIMRQLLEGPDGKTNNLCRGLLGSAAARTVRTATGNSGRADDRRGPAAIASLRPKQPGP